MQENYKPKVLFAMVEAGLGHIAPLSGVYEAFLSKYGHLCRVEKSLVFTDSKYPSVQKMGLEQSGHVKKLIKSKAYNNLEALSYKLPSKLILWGLDRHFGKGRKDFIKELGEIKPDLVFSTYYLPTHLARQSNQKKLTDTLTATFSPDAYIYPAWDRKCDLFLVNNEKAYKDAIKKGFNIKKVKQVPFIFKKGVTEVKLNKQQARESLNLNKDKYTILFSSGAYGAQDTEELIKELLKLDISANLVVVCGKSQEMKDSMERLRGQKSQNVDYHVVGFTDKLPEYMRAADVLIGKSSMNTIIEAVYHNCPVITNVYANAIEKRTLEFCLEKGIVLYIKKPSEIAQTIVKHINGQNPFGDFNKNAKQFQRTDGAEVAADALFELLKTKFPNL